MNKDINEIEDKILLDDERISRFLQGVMDAGEESAFLEELKGNPDLRQRATTQARLIKGMKQVDEELVSAFKKAEKSDIIQLQNSFKHESNGKNAAIGSIPRNNILDENDDDLQEQSSKSYSVFTIRRFIAAASILIVFFVSYRTYDYYDTTNLGKEYANTFSITTIVRGETNESVENELATLFENVANNEKLDETITRLSVLWQTAKQDTYNDYIDYAPYIGWYLAIAYLEDYDKDKAKVVLKINTGAAVLGLGYIIGLKYAAIICAGSLAVWLLIVPGMNLLFGDQLLNAWNPAITQTISEMAPETIFKEYAKSIGIGGIAMAGVIGIFRSWGIIKSAVGLAAKEMGGKKADSNVKRTQKDLSMKVIAFGSIFTLLLTFVFFLTDVMHGNLLHSIVAILLVAGISFLFTTVAANAIAIVGTNPVSGMTLMTLILASVVMVAVGLKGATGMVAALVMGGVVCTALSMAGGFITDLKIGYWLGTTPAKQQTWKFLGTLVSAATVGGVIMILNKTYGFTSGALAAPQANAMAAVIDPLMNGVGAPWLLYGIGAALALVLTYFNIPALAFALGMFIPLELNLPLLVGGAINWYVTTRSKDEKINNERGEKGTLLASGFIAGGALMGVVSAAMRFGGINLVNESWLANPMSELASLVVYALLIVYLIKASMNIQKK